MTAKVESPSSIYTKLTVDGPRIPCDQTLALRRIIVKEIPS